MHPELEEGQERLLYEFEYPIKNLRPLTPSSDSSLLVGPGYEKLKDTLFVYASKTGQLLHKIVLKYQNFKDYLSIIAVPKRATQVITGIVAKILSQSHFTLNSFLTD